MAISSLTKLVPGTRQLAFNKFIQILKQETIPLEIVDVQGQTWETVPGNIRHRLMIRDHRFFNALLSPNAYSLGSAYINGYFDVSGNMRELYEMVCDKLLSTDQSVKISDFFSKMVSPVLALLPSGIREKEKENIRYQYDQPGRFFRIFLGETMGYTCGYYSDQNSSMSDAQNKKMEIVCKKLRLTSGQHLLDIGCGWGNLSVYAAKHYGVQVTGITLSQEQKTYAEEWIKKEGLVGQVKIKLLNYRDLENNQYDKIACVGMSEHVGRDNMSTFYDTVYRCLKPGGLFMQHTITTYSQPKKSRNNLFLDTYMFPGGELMREQDLVDLAGQSGFELLNAENFRPHYVKTLADWISRMEQHREQLIDIVDETTYRIYHVFFIGSLISFRQKEIALFQNLFCKTGSGIEGDHLFTTPYAETTSFTAE